MASPLSWFRRNQKGMLVVFGVLLMAAFGLGSVMVSLTPRGTRDRSQETEVVQWKDGTFTNWEFDGMRRRHFQAMNFLQQLYESISEQRGGNYQPRAQMLRPLATNVSPDQMDSEMMNRILLLKEAGDFGMVVGDDAVMSYLRNLADDQTLSTRDMDVLAARIFGGSVSFSQIREQLKKELAIENISEMVFVGFPGRPGLTEAWSDFQKLERKIECETMAFPVDDYLGKVTDTPSESQLRNLYSQGKYDLPDPTGQRPGFKQPRKMTVGVMTANFDQFLERAKLAITPEQIQAEYDRLVELKDPLVIEYVNPLTGDGGGQGADPPPTLDDLLTPETDGDAKSGEEPSGEPAGESSGEPADGDAGSGGEEKGSGGEEKNGAADSGDSGSDKPGDPVEKPAADPKPSGDAPADGLIPVSTAAAWTRPDVQETEKQETQETEKQETGPAGTASDSDRSAAEAAADADDKPASADQDTPPTLDDLQAPDTAPATAPDTAPGAVAGMQDDPLSVNPNPLETRIRPLDEVLSIAIRGRLANKPAMDAMNIAVSEAAADIGDFGMNYDLWQETKDLPRGEREPEPDPIDPKKIASERQLDYQQEDLVSFFDFSRTDLGETMIGIDVQTMFGIQRRQQQLAQLLFTRYHELKPWEPQEYEEYFRNNRLIVFILDKVDPVIPEFAEARDSVEQYWKRQQAVDLATAAAQDVARQLNDNNEQLTTRYPSDARNTGDFSWHTQVGRYPVLPGDIRPGEDFMDVAFSTAVDKAGVAPDLTRENVYVIQPIRAETRSDDDLQKLFFESLSANQGTGAGINQLYTSQLLEVRDDWFDQLNEKYDVKWLAN